MRILLSSGTRIIILLYRRSVSSGGKCAMFSTFSPRTKFRLQFATHVHLLFKVPRVRDFTKYGKFRIRRHRRVVDSYLVCRANMQMTRAACGKLIRVLRPDRIRRGRIRIIVREMTRSIPVFVNTKFVSFTNSFFEWAVS